MKALPLTVIAFSIILSNAQPPQSWINYKGYWYVLYRGPHPPSFRYAERHTPPPRPVKISVVDIQPPPKIIQASPALITPQVTPPPLANPVGIPPPSTSVTPQPAPQPALSHQLVRPQQRAKPPVVVHPHRHAQPPGLPQQQAPQQRQIYHPEKPGQQQPAHPAQQQPPAPPQRVAPPRQPEPSFLPAPPSQPASAFQPAGAQGQPALQFQPSHQSPSQPRQPAPPGMPGPQRSPSSGGHWNHVPVWNPDPAPQPMTRPSSGVNYLSPGKAVNRRPAVSQGQKRYSSMVPQQNSGPLPHAFHPGPVGRYHQDPYGRPAPRGYRPLEPPDIDIPLTACGPSIKPPTTPPPLLMGPLPPTPAPDPRCRCEDPQDCDTLTDPDPVCPAWTSCCCRPLPPTAAPPPTNTAPVG